MNKTAARHSFLCKDIHWPKVRESGIYFTSPKRYDHDSSFEAGDIAVFSSNKLLGEAVITEVVDNGYAAMVRLRFDH